MTDAVPPKRPSLPKQLQLFGEYVVDSLIEEGPTWALYKALHIANESQRYRVRVLQGVDATRRQVVEAFARMAILLESLKHEGIIPISAAGVDQGLVFVINAEVPGITLEQRATKGPAPLEPAEIVRIVRETAAVLDYLHQHDPPIIHHTLEPSKILLSQPTGSVKVLEVGYAHAVDEVARVEAVPHAPQASENYRAPEDVPGAAPRAEIDQFALARIAKMCLESRKSPVLEAALRATEAVIARATASDPAQRFPNAGAFAKAFADSIDQASARANAPTDQHPAATGMVPTSVGAPRTRKPTPPAILAGRAASPATAPPVNRKATILGGFSPPPAKAPPPPAGDASGPPKKISGSLPVPRPAGGATNSPSAKALADATATTTQKGLGTPAAPAAMTPAAPAIASPPKPASSVSGDSWGALGTTSEPVVAPATTSSDPVTKQTLSMEAPKIPAAPTAPPPLPGATASAPVAPPPLPAGNAAAPAAGASETSSSQPTPAAASSDPFSDVPVETISMVPLDEFDKSQVTSVSSPDEDLLAKAFPSEPPDPHGAVTKDMSIVDSGAAMASAVSTAPLYGGPPSPSPPAAGAAAPMSAEPALPSAFAAPSGATASVPRKEAAPAASSSPSSSATTQPPPPKPSGSSAVRIATILGVSIVLASVVYTAGFMLREPLTQLASQRGFHAGGANQPGNGASQANVSPTDPQHAVNAAMNDAMPSTVTPTAANDASAPTVANVTPDAGAPHVVAAANDAGPVVVANNGNEHPANAGTNVAVNANAPDAGSATPTTNANANANANAPPATNTNLPRRPSPAAQEQAESAIEHGIAACNGHLGHHAYISVVYDSSGSVSTVEFTGHTLDGNPLTTCLEAAVRAVTIPPFRDAHWEKHYTFMIR